MIDSINIVFVDVMIDKRYLEEVLGVDDYEKFIDEDGKKGYSFSYKTVEFKYYLYGNLVAETTTHKILDKKDITLSDKEEYKSKVKNIVEEVLNYQEYEKSLLTQIDYCADITVGEEKVEEYVKVMNKHCSKYKHKKRIKFYSTSIQISSEHGKLIKGYDKIACIKDKANIKKCNIIIKYNDPEIKREKLKALEEQVSKELSWYKGVIRLEVSIRKDNLKYYYKESRKKVAKAKKLQMSKEEFDKLKIEYRNIDNYWNKENMNKHFFEEIKQYYYTGNYYKLSIAVQKINESQQYSERWKNKLILFLCRVKCAEIDRVKRIEIYSKGTIRNYIKILSE